MLGIVYVIKNKINGKCYVGQTRRSFIRRYRGGKWWKYTKNGYLKNAAIKYGDSNFELIITSTQVNDPILLDKLEYDCAIKYNSYAPNGYNIAVCGETGKISKTTSINLKPTYTNYVKLPVKRISTGEILYIDNFSRFKRDNKLNGKIYKIKEIGFRLGDFTNQYTQPYDFSNREFYSMYNMFPPYKVYGKNDEEIIFYDIKKFISDNNLSSQKFNKFLSSNEAYKYKHFYKHIGGHNRWIEINRNRELKKYENITNIGRRDTKNQILPVIYKVFIGKKDRLLNKLSYNIYVKYEGSNYVKTFSNLEKAIVYRDKINYAIYGKNSTFISGNIEMSEDERKELLNKFTEKKKPQIM